MFYPANVFCYTANTSVLNTCLYGWVWTQLTDEYGLSDTAYHESIILFMLYMKYVEHSAHSLDANKALSCISCFINISATGLLLYFSYSTNSNALIYTYLCISENFR